MGDSIPRYREKQTSSSTTMLNGPFPISGDTMDRTPPFLLIKLQTLSNTCKIRGRLLFTNHSFTLEVREIALVDRTLFLKDSIDKTFQRHRLSLQHPSQNIGVSNQTPLIVISEHSHQIFDRICANPAHPKFPVL